MAWTRLDDNFPTHPKVLRAMQKDPLSPWLYVCGLTYCRRYLKGDGMIPELAVPTLMPLYKPRMKAALIEVGLWEQIGAEWVYVHDYPDWNYSEDAQREARSEKASKAASARWEKQRLNEINTRTGNHARTQA